MDSIDWTTTAARAILGEEVVDQLHQIEELVQRLDSVLEGLAGEDDNVLVGLRAGTVLTISILDRAFGGFPADFNLVNPHPVTRFPSAFDLDDWVAIAKNVDEYAVRVDGQSYTEFVFNLYARYIAASAATLAPKISKSQHNAILGLANELNNRTASLRAGEINEPRYVEDCLWICLEAMAKLLSALAFSKQPAEYSDLCINLADYSLACARLAMYQREQALLQQYLEHQSRLDDELQSRLDAYLLDLERQSAQFYVLLERAFDSDFRLSFRGSVVLAQTVGVPKDEVLETEDDIDRFFLD